jgi:hypothetical protein
MASKSTTRKKKSFLLLTSGVGANFDGTSSSAGPRHTAHAKYPSAVQDGPHQLDHQAEESEGTAVAG